MFVKFEDEFGDLELINTNQVILINQSKSVLNSGEYICSLEFNNGRITIVKGSLDMIEKIIYNEEIEMYRNMRGY